MTTTHTSNTQQHEAADVETAPREHSGGPAARGRRSVVYDAK